LFGAQQDNAILAWLSSLVEEHDPGQIVTRTEAYTAEEREPLVADVDAVFEVLALGVARRAERWYDHVIGFGHGWAV
jgi:hypothetical protein